VNGDGQKGHADIVLYFNQMPWIAANEPVTAFDCNGNDLINLVVVWLFNLWPAGAFPSPSDPGYHPGVALLWPPFPHRALIIARRHCRATSECKFLLYAPGEVVVSIKSAKRRREMEKQNQSVGELVAKLVEGTTYQMLDAAEGIGVHGASAVGAVAPLLRSQERETRWRAAVALERIGAPSIEALVTAARDPDYLVRVPAIWALEHIGGQKAVTALVENLDTGNECCRWMAAAALTQIGGEQERAAVESAFANDAAGRGYVEELIEGS
jgi:hypothetical protein